MTDRDRAIRDLLARARAAGRRMFGFGGPKAGCAELGGRLKAVPDEWTHCAVEGDATWTLLPVETDVALGERGR